MPMALSGEDKSFGGWRYEIKTDDRDDPQVHSASTSALAGEGGSFIVWCRNPRSGLYLMYKTGKNMVNADERREITYRVDKKPPVKQQWYSLQNGIFNDKLTEVIDMVDALIGGDELVIQTYDSNFHGFQSTFSLDGAGDAITRVLENCNA